MSSHAKSKLPRTSPLVRAHLLGLVDFRASVALQHRLVYESSHDPRAPCTLLICEHPPAISIGREGSRRHLAWSGAELARWPLSPHWVARGGGCVAHAPGQLAVYPIVPLAALGWTVGQYLERLQAGLSAALGELRFPCEQRPGEWGLWGRSGQLAVLGVAVRHWVAHFGAYLNVSPSPAFTRRVATDISGRAPMGSLLAERVGGVRMSTVREALLRHLASALGSDDVHFQAGHPLLAPARRTVEGFVARVG